MLIRLRTTCAIAALSIVFVLPAAFGANSDEGVDPNGREIEGSDGPKITKDNVFQILTRDLTREYTVERRRLKKLELSNSAAELKEFKVAEAKFKIKNVYVNGEANLRKIKILLDTKAGVYLLGEPGVGKTALMEALAREGYEILVLKNAMLTSGTKYRGALEKNITTLLTALQDANGRYVLFIDEAHQMMSNETFISEIKRLMDRGQLKVVMGTTLNEYRKYIEPDQAATRRGATQIIEKPSVREVIHQFIVRRPIYKTIYGVDISEKAIVEAVEQTNQLFRGQPLGSRVEQVIEYALSAAASDIFGVNEKVGKLTDQIHIKKAQLWGTTADLRHAQNAGERTQELFNQEMMLKNEVADLEKQLSDSLKHQGLDKLADQATQGQSLGKGPQLKLDRQVQVEKRILAEEDVLDYQARNQTKEIIKLLGQARAELQVANEQIASIDQQIAEHTQRELKDKMLNEKDIRLAIAEKFNVSSKIMMMTPAQRIDQLKKVWHDRIKDQDHILKAIVDKLEARDFGLALETKAMVFYVSGASDAIIEEISHVINESYFGREAAPLKFDMSHYQNNTDLWSARGSNVGYKGSDDEGKITGPIRRTPFSVFWFKKFDMAHTEISQWLSDGFSPNDTLVDNNGNPASLLEGITILSSDVLADWSMQKSKMLRDLKSNLPLFPTKIAEQFNLSGDQVKAIAFDSSLTPEQKISRLDQLIGPQTLRTQSHATDSFIANLDGILTASPLSFEMAQLTARAHLNRIKASIESKYKIHFEASDTVVNAVAFLAVRNSNDLNHVVRVSNEEISSKILREFFRKRNDQPFAQKTHLKIDFSGDSQGGEFSLSLDGKPVDTYPVQFPRVLSTPDFLKSGRGELAAEVGKFDPAKARERAHKDAK